MQGVPEVLVVSLDGGLALYNLTAMQVLDPSHCTVPSSGVDSADCRLPLYLQLQGLTLQ